MTRPPRDFPQRLRIILVLAAPAAVVLLVLTVGGFLSFGPAVIGWLLILAGIAWLAWPPLRALSALFRYVRHTADTAGGPAGGFGLIGLSRDIARAVRRLDSAWQQRSSELRASIKANESLLDALNDPLILLTETGAVARVNAAAAQLFGSGLAGRSLASTVRAPDLIDAVEAVRAGDGPREFHLTVTEPTQRTFSGVVDRLDAAAPDGGDILVLLHDITAALRMDQMRADFVANAGHEIRTPLTTLVGMIETLRGPARDDPEAREQFLEMMDDHGKRIARLVDDLLSLSRIEMAANAAPDDPVDVPDLLRSAAKNLRWQAEQHDVDIALDLPADLPPTAGDASELIQAFQNLIDNAIKYGGPEKTVRVSAARVADGDDDEPMIAVTVADQGPGIPDEFLSRLTERFFRVDTARSRELGGTGLGLAIVKHVLNRHRGRLDIASTLGEGSQFTIYLPIVARPPDPA